jgi:LacI family transcriptional regulator
MSVVTMKDVAEKAGVSQATVSRVLGGTGVVSPRKRAIVLEWVRRLDYRPNFAAKTLAENRSYLVGMVLPDLQNPFYTRLVGTIESEARRHGFNLIVTNSECDGRVERNNILALKARQIDGLLIIPSHPNSPVFDSTVRGSLPVVSLATQTSGVPSVSIAHSRGGALVAEHLGALGRRRVLLVGAGDDEKLSGFREEITNSRFDIDVVSTQPDPDGDTSISRAERFIADWLQSNPSESIDAVFCGNDVMAVGGINALVKSGRSIPDDVAVVGFDDTFIAEGSRPTLTSVSQPMQEMGRIAFEALLRRIDGLEGEGPEDDHWRLEPRLVIRESTMGTGW